MKFELKKFCCNWLGYLKGDLFLFLSCLLHSKIKLFLIQLINN